MNNPFEYVEGKYPPYNELVDWTEERWMNFLNYICFFIASYENSEKWRVNDALMKEMEAYLEIPNHPFHEMIYRTGQWVGKTTPNKFRLKIAGMTMHTLRYLKKHPGIVTQRMNELIGAHPQQLGWCLEQYKVQETQNGGEIVVRDNTVKGELMTKQTSLPSLQAQVMTSVVKVADIISILAGSVSATELRKLDTKEKLNQITKLMPILTQVNKAKMVGNSFTQVNINGSTEDLERAALAYIEKTNQ